MTIRVRSLGSRRRCSGSTLVRSIPALTPNPPPIPLAGFITRVMRASLISDYEAISDTAWSTGVTGDISDSGGTHSGTSMNCFYHYYTTPNMRTTGAEFLMEPIRWSIAAPATDGGDYDFWSDFGSIAVARSAFGGSSIPIAYLGKIGITDTLLPVGSHAKWKSGFVQSLVTMSWTGVPQRLAGNFTDFGLAAFQAIDPTYQIWNSPLGYSGGIDPLGTTGIYAIRHRVNGSFVGDVILDPPSTSLRGEEWRADIGYGDTYEIDIWYKLKSSAYLINPAAPGKACAYIPTSVVSSGSEKTVSVQKCQFENIDFSTKFNFEEQSYYVSVAGHSGWTLKGGSDGPHRMITADGWTATITNGSIIWEKDTDDDYCRAIILRWDREIAHIEFLSGSLMDSAVPNGAVFYRIDDGNTVYRNDTVSAVDGAVEHATPGLFPQAGFSTFKLVPWTVASAASGTVEPAAAEGRVSGSVTSYSELPTSISVRRFNR